MEADTTAQVLTGPTDTVTKTNKGHGEEKAHTVEVGSLHTLMLESIKLVFQPLHKFLVNVL
jgi:hypothetical protein